MLEEVRKHQEEQRARIAGTYIQKSEDKDIEKGEDNQLTPQQHQDFIKSQINNSIGGSTLSLDELEKSANNYFEKGVSKHAIGEIKTFGGREYIKTTEGWKYHGKGTGKKAQSHVHASVTPSLKEHTDLYLQHQQKSEDYMRHPDYHTSKAIQDKYEEHNAEAGKHWNAMIELKKKRGDDMGEKVNPQVGETNPMFHKDLADEAKGTKDKNGVDDWIKKEGLTDKRTPEQKGKERDLTIKEIGESGKIPTGGALKDLAANLGMSTQALKEAIQTSIEAHKGSKESVATKKGKGLVELTRFSNHKHAIHGDVRISGWEAGKSGGESKVVFTKPGKSGTYTQNKSEFIKDIGFDGEATKEAKK